MDRTVCRPFSPMKTSPLIISPICILLVLGGCATTPHLKPRITFEEVALEQITLFSSTLVFTFKATNPAPVPLKLRDITYTLEAEDRPLFTGRNAGPLVIPARDSAMFRLPAELNHLELAGSLAELFSREQLTYHLTGTVKNGPFTLPFARHGTIPLPRSPDIRLRELTLSSATPLGIHLTACLELENSNDFAFTPAGLSYSLVLDGQTILSGTTEAIPRTQPRDTTTLEIPIHLDFLQLARTITQLLQQGGDAITLSGELSFRAPDGTLHRLPFAVRQEKAP